MIFVPQMTAEVIRNCNCTAIAEVLAAKAFTAVESCKILIEKALSIFRTKPEVNPEAAAASLEKLRNIIEKFGEDSLTAKIVRSFGGIEAFKSLPHLEWNERFLGYDYIDAIKHYDMRDSVMWGVDRFDRFYISVKTTKKIERTDLGDLCIEIGNLFDRSSFGVETFFQRYTDEGDTWTSGNGSYNHRIKLLYSKMTDNDFVNFQNLVNNKEVVLGNAGDFVYKFKLV